MNLKFSLLFFLMISIVGNAQQKPQALSIAYWTESVPGLKDADAPFHTTTHHSDLYFEGDSVWRLDYPCKRLNVSAYSPKDFHVLNDSIFELWGKKFSLQKSVDTNAIAVLKKHAFNAKCYTGKWKLLSSKSGGDGTGVDFIYPFKIENELILKAGALDEKVLRLMIDGEQREFYFELERYNFDTELILKPVELSKEKVMWAQFWGAKPLNDEELKALKQSEGIPLELHFLKSR